eukprot:363785-Chlamydomonas_euryale.AAC.4
MMLQHCWFNTDSCLQPATMATALFWFGAHSSPQSAITAAAAPLVWRSQLPAVSDHGRRDRAVATVRRRALQRLAHLQALDHLAKYDVLSVKPRSLQTREGWRKRSWRVGERGHWCVGQRGHGGSEKGAMGVSVKEAMGGSVKGGMGVSVKGAMGGWLKGDMNKTVGQAIRGSVNRGCGVGCSKGPWVGRSKGPWVGRSKTGCGSVGRRAHV